MPRISGVVHFRTEDIHTFSRFIADGCHCCCCRWHCIGAPGSMPLSWSWYSWCSPLVIACPAIAVCSHICLCTAWFVARKDVWFAFSSALHCCPASVRLAWLPNLLHYSFLLAAVCSCLCY